MLGNQVGVLDGILTCIRVTVSFYFFKFLCVDLAFISNFDCFTGYITVAINPTGSTGYGDAFTKAIHNQWGGKPYQVSFFDD